MTHLEFFLLWRNTKSNGAVMEAVCALNVTDLEILVEEAEYEEVNDV